MPKVQQYDWGNLKPRLPEVKTTHVTDADAVYWRYKKKTPPTSTSKKHGAVRLKKKRKTKLKDKTLFSDNHDQIKHLRDISRGDA